MCCSTTYIVCMATNTNTDWNTIIEGDELVSIPEGGKLICETGAFQVWEAPAREVTDATGRTICLVTTWTLSFSNNGWTVMGRDVRVDA